MEILTIPLKAPFITALGRKSATTNVFLSLSLDGGGEGRGEASGSVVMAHQKPARLASVLRDLIRGFHRRDARNIRTLTSEIWRLAGRTPAAAAAFESALTDALLNTLEVPMHLWFGGAQKTIETDLTLSASAPEEAGRTAAQAAQEGFRKLKIKVGTGGRSDLRRVLAADKAGRCQGRRPEIILDGNQSLSEKSALKLVENCLSNGIKAILLEQPLPRRDLKGAARLKRRCPIPLAADESVRNPEEAYKVLDMDAADVINVKTAKTGLQAALEIIALTQAAGKRLMIGCMQESSLGLSPSVHLACGTGAFEFVDLDSDHLLIPRQPQGDFSRRGAKLSV